MKLLLYCTKANKYDRLVRDEHYGKPFYLCGAITENFESLNGKIVAECDFEVEEISRIKSWNSTEDYDWEYETPTLYYYDLLRESCLTCDEFEEYIEFSGYAIHIKNLNIFDEPRELYDCLIHPKIEHRYYGCEHLSKAPQNMMYVELDDIKYVLISIKPEWLCKILNGEKTIEVRRKVLKEMK